MATRTVQCPICQEDIKDPRLLPCIHSFCLECLQRYCRDKLPGDDVPCPVCRSGFQIPINGVACLSVRTHAEEPASANEPSRKQYCEKHEERIKIHCFECNMNVCAMCCIEDHKTHTFERIETVFERSSRAIDNDIEQITSRIECFRGVADQLQTEHNEALENIEATELEVKNRSESLVAKLIQLVERQTADVLEQLQTLKSVTEEEVKSHQDILQFAMAEMESFRTSTLELRSKGSPSDITEAANEVHERAKELLESYVIPSEYHAPSHTFTAVNVDELLREDQNFIGHVVEIRYSAENNVSGDDSSSDGQAVRDTSSQQLQQGDIIETFRQSYLNSGTGESISLGVNAKTLQRGSLYTVVALRRSNVDRVAIPASVIQKISTGDYVLGLTSVDDELFVLLHRDDNQVAVYSIDDYQRLGYIDLPKFRPNDDSDMTSCVRQKCLYMSDRHNICIHKYELASSATSKWPLPGKSRGLSVTPNSNLLVTCQGERNILVELSADSGECVREIALRSDIVRPRHSVQLTTGQFVVCHGEWGNLHRVCVAGDDSKVTRTYGGQPGSDVGQLNYPYHLAVDKDSQFIFVADNGNNRVVLLSPTLEYVRDVIGGLTYAHRLYLHQATRRLFVGHGVCGAIVIQL